MEKFFIGPMQSGLRKDVKPFLINDDAFARLQNAYVFRGRVRKRFGERLMIPNTGHTNGFEHLTSRLRLSVGVTDAAGNIGPVAIAAGGLFKIGALFSATGLNGAAVLGTDVFTVITNVGPFALLSSTVGATGIFDTTTGTLTLANTRRNATVYFYPSEPVMGLLSYETVAVNDEPLIAFDTRFAYTYLNTGWERAGLAVWTQNANADSFFWGETHRGTSASDDLLFVTNFVQADGIKYWDGAAWVTMQPIYNAAGDTIQTARIILSFKNRLVLLNTLETAGGVPHRSRCRFSQNGTPVIAADPTAWREDIPGKGGWIDLPTQEAIITAQHLRDRVIVYCERSTWELVYTGNQVLPFIWQQINTELGAESTFSQVPFDQAVIGIGNVGIHSCNGMEVKRIDQLIPSEVFELHNENAALQRIAGVRDYFAEQIYWTVPSWNRNATHKFPDQVLCFNYASGAWALFDDSITAWGYGQQGNDEKMWSELTDFTWAEWGDIWGGQVFNPKTRSVMAGNQEGFVFVVDPDKSTNCPALQITSIGAGPSFTVIDHNLEVGEFVLIENCVGSTEFNGNIYQILNVSGQNTFELDPMAFTAYLGNGTITRVSRIDILTKQYNFFMDQAKNIFFSAVNFHVDKTEHGAITVDYSTSSTGRMMSEDAVATNCMLGDTVLETSPYARIPLEQQQSRVWHTKFLQAEGECIQLRLYLSDTQMLDKALISEDFQLNSMIFDVQSTYEF